MVKPEAHMSRDRIGAEVATTQLNGWLAVVGRDAIAKSYKFKDFKSAWAFMTQAALKAEQMDHHPEWLNVYNKVEVTLATHDAGGVTALDVELARFMDQVAAQ
jgi:4a-hydroxytetrahydrobiopterin dehydratase